MIEVILFGPGGDESRFNGFIFTDFDLLGVLISVREWRRPSSSILSSVRGVCIWVVVGVI